MRSSGLIVNASFDRFHTETITSPLIVGVDQADEIPEHDAVLVSQPGARQHDGREPGIGKVDGDAARNELRRPRSELERLFDARAQVETRRPGCGILRQRIAQPRSRIFTSRVFKRKAA